MKRVGCWMKHVPTSVISLKEPSGSTAPMNWLQLMKSKYPDFGNRWTLHFSAQSWFSRKPA